MINRKMPIYFVPFPTFRKKWHEVRVNENLNRFEDYSRVIFSLNESFKGLPTGYCCLKEEQSKFNGFCSHFLTIIIASCFCAVAMFMCTDTPFKVRKSAENKYKELMRAEMCWRDGCWVIESWLMDVSLMFAVQWLWCIAHHATVQSAKQKKNRVENRLFFSLYLPKG